MGQPAHPPTVHDQLDFFAGTWVVSSPGQADELEGHWEGERLRTAYPTQTDGHRPCFEDRFDYENPSYVRRDTSANPRMLMVSPGWHDDRWTWQAIDCSARIIYDRIDDDTLVVTEQELVTDVPRRTYRTVRRFEARRQ